MRDNITLCFLLITLIICVSNCSTDKNHSIIGNWITETISSDVLHASTKFPVKDSIIIKEHRIDAEFEIQFNENNKFFIQERNGLVKNGIYKLNKDTLVLQLKNSPNDWLALKIRNLSQDKLVLDTEVMFFHSFLLGDSVEFATGENVKLELKKKLN